jgi:hypothetical protein
MQASVKAFFYFIASIIITFLFIKANPVYNTFSFQLMAFGIAATVWGIQLIGALIFLKDKKYDFLYEAGKVCFWGSAFLLLPVVINFYIRPSANVQLQLSAIGVLASVLMMAILFFLFVKRLHLSYGWLVTWLASLCVAVPLQAKLVGFW